MLVEQRSVAALDDAVGLRAVDPRGAVFDPLQLQEQLVGVLVGPAAELAAIVGEYSFDLGVVLLEGRLVPEAVLERFATLGHALIPARTPSRGHRARHALLVARQRSLRVRC